MVPLVSLIAITKYPTVLHRGPPYEPECPTIHPSIDPVDKGADCVIIVL